jgi:hypothetical protein
MPQRSNGYEVHVLVMQARNPMQQEKCLLPNLRARLPKR